MTLFFKHYLQILKLQLEIEIEQDFQDGELKKVIQVAHQFLLNPGKENEFNLKIQRS